MEKIQREPAFWNIDGPQGHVVLSSRMRLARNMDGVVFPHRITDIDNRFITDAVNEFLHESVYRDNLKIIHLHRISAEKRRYLRERNIITADMENSSFSSVVIAPENNFSILVNDIDHFRIQVIRPGLQLRDAFRMADSVDSELNRFVPYAFSEEFGYLTPVVSNIGTGLRVSVLLHLPALTIKNKSSLLMQELKESGVELRGTAGNGRKTVGSIYQLSNIFSLGLSEVDIIEVVDQAVSRALEYEDQERDLLMSGSRLEVEDTIWRSLGILTYSKKIDYTEAMAHLSNLRLGILLAVIKDLKIDMVNDCMVRIQHAHLQKNYSVQFKNSSETDEYRADYISRIIGKSEVV